MKEYYKKHKTREVNKMSIKKKRRPNYFENRYNQFTLAGKIAVKNNFIDPFNIDGSIATVYKSNSGGVDYSSIGQDYLRHLDITIAEL
jgi:hypothetical protein